MSRKKPTGKQKGSVQKKVDWKALEIVHPHAAGAAGEDQPDRLSPPPEQRQHGAGGEGVGSGRSREHTGWPLVAVVETTANVVG